MQLLKNLKSMAKRIFTVICAVILTVTSGIITSDMVTMKASAATLYGSKYLSETFTYQESRTKWKEYLNAYSTGTYKDFYLSTKYVDWLGAASPKGYNWQYPTYKANGIDASTGGMNCTGFVWFAIAHSLSVNGGKGITETGTWVPNTASFNNQGFSVSSWSGGGWWTYITQKNVHYYEFSTKSEMLNSGVLQKGDIIWCVNAEVGSGLAGLKNTNNYHHIGIYMGDGKSDSWWQSGPINGDGNTTGEINSINQIYGKAAKNTYVVIPWAAEEEAPTLDPTKIMIQKQDSETGKASAQGSASLAGAEFTMKYYTGTTASGTPVRTWVIKTDSNGLAKLDSAHLVSGTIYTDSDGNPGIPLGTVTIQETKAPTGYQINSNTTTLHIVNQNGTAKIQASGSTTYLQTYTATYSEQIVRGDMSFSKIYENEHDDGHFTYIPFILKNEDTGEWHIVVTDDNGMVDTTEHRNVANNLDVYKSKLTTKSGEYTLTADDMQNIISTMGSSAAMGVWFGGGSVSTTLGALPYGNYSLTEIRCPKNEGYTLISKSFVINASNTDQNLGVLVDNSFPCIIRGKKTDTEGKPVSRARIGIFPNDTTEFTYDTLYQGVIAKSDEDGEFTFNNIPAGTYKIKELEAPYGYILSDKVYTITVNPSEDGEIIEMGDDIVNKQVLANIHGEKTDKNGKPVAGAVIGIFQDSETSFTEENAIQTVISDQNGEFTFQNIPMGSYNIKEIAPPDGYKLSEEVYLIEVSEEDADKTIEMDDNIVNEKTGFDIHGKKTDAEGTPLSDAVIGIFSESETAFTQGNAIQIVTSDENGEFTFRNIPIGSYNIKEITPPDGYILSEEVYPIEISESQDSDPVEMGDNIINEPTTVEFEKTDENGNPLSGATMQVQATNVPGVKTGTTIDEWETDGSVHTITGKLVVGGGYILSEASAPDGYYRSTAIYFTVNEDGSISDSNGNPIDLVTMADAATVVEITKQDEDGSLLSGALLQILDGEGNVVDEWTSGTEAHVITAKLNPGKTYTLHEEKAPTGYVAAEDQQFTVNTNGSVTKLTMIDLATVVRIDKVDPDGNSLKGASLQILDSKENILDAWTSDGTVHEIKAVLAAGETYTLRETASPSGYYVSDDTNFTVNTDGTPNEITLYNVKTKVSITKYDITGENELAGAFMQVKDTDGNILDEWTSTAEAHIIEGVLSVGKTYILHEETAPDGYVIAEDIEFTVAPDGTVTTISMMDDITKVSITKKDITGENEIAGAALEIRDADGNLIDSWISDGTAHVINGILVAGATYTLHEVSAPDGYVVASDVEFTVDASGNVTSVTMLDDTTKVSITKTNITGDAEIPGASMEVRDADGNLIDAWVSDGTPHQIIGVLAVGQTYTLHEVAAPNGYVVATDIAFTVNEDGSVTEISMKDDTTKVQLSKKSITGDDELPGASMELYDANGTLIDAWISESTPHYIEGILTAGAEYTLHEVSAPNGYIVASDIRFTVNTDGSVDQVTMVDDTTKVEISKYDITTGELLEGATLQIIDQNGSVVEEWISTAETHMIEAVLTAGETYTLRETAAPNGYVIANEVTFTVNEDGSVTPVEMYDDITKVSITKYDITGENELSGAALEIRDADGNLIDAWVSTSEAHEINGVLIAGAEYTLHEVTSPNGYVVASDVTFTVNADGSVTTVSMYDYPTVVHITKKDITTGEELPGAYLELYDKDNNLIDSWVSTDEAHIIEAVLIAGETYTLIETSAPDGYVISEQISFTVNLDNTITHVEMFDDTTKVQLSKKAITGDDELPGASMQLLDKDGNIVDEWVSGTEPHMIEGVLIAGEAYTLHEETAPNGYVVASDITFTVSTDGKVDIITMVDDTTKAEISKTDITGENPVSGALLQIKDKNGNVIHEWISGEDVNIIEAQLTAGETYILHEESAPNGYVISEDIEFTVNTDGTINQVQMKDDTTKVSITKYDIVSGKELPGATLQIIDKNGNVIEEWVSTAEAHLIEGVLTSGETYILREITAPNGWTVTEDITFTVNTDGSITHVEMYDTPTVVSILKVDSDNKNLTGALLQILDADGNVIEEWTTDDEAHIINAKLIAGETYTLHEVSAPDGYEIAADQTFTVDENGETTEVVMVDEKTPDKTETPTTPDKPSVPSTPETPAAPVATPTTPTTTSSPKTADAMPLTALSVGLIASLILMFFARKKRKIGKAA